MRGRYDNGTDVVQKVRKLARRGGSKASWLVRAKPLMYTLIGVAAGFGLGVFVRSRA